MNLRNEDIIQLRLQGCTLQSIGDYYNLTKERVRQILQYFNIEKPKVKKKEKTSYIKRSEERLLKKVQKTKEGCWNFIGLKTKTGYGKFSYCGVSQYAHRASYQIFNKYKLKNEGLISSETICVLHTCRNRSCVNPDHLYLGTQQDNARDRELDKINNIRYSI